MQGPDWSKAKASEAAPFRFREINGSYLVANDLGDWLLLSPEAFKAFVEGPLAEDGDLRERLADSRLLASAIDVDDATRRYRDRRWFLAQGPHLHVLALNGEGGDEPVEMDVDTAERALDCAFMSTSERLVLALRGVEPLAAWDVLTHAVIYAEEKNRLALKTLEIVVDTRLGEIDDDKLAWLIEHDTAVRVRVDAAALDDPERTLHLWIPKLNASYADRAPEGGGRTVTLIAEVGQALLDRVTEIVDLAATLGCHEVELQPPHDDRFLLGDAGRPDCSIDAWLVAYDKALEQAVGHDKAGRPLVEHTARVFLTKVLTHRDPNDAGIRTPASDGIGQLAYGWDGRVYASDAGRRIGELGDPVFQLGELRYNGYHDMVSHPIVRALILATTLEGQADCAACVYQAFCGQCPAANYAEQGSIQGRMRDSSTCRKLKTIQDMLFARLAAGHDATRKVFDRWAGVS